MFVQARKHSVIFQFARLYLLLLSILAVAQLELIKHIYTCLRTHITPLIYIFPDYTPSKRSFKNKPMDLFSAFYGMFYHNFITDMEI